MANEGGTKIPKTKGITKQLQEPNKQCVYRIENFLSESSNLEL